MIAAVDEFDRADAYVRLRIVHASPDAPAVNVGTVEGATLGTLLAQDLEFSATTPGKGISLTAQLMTVGIAAAQSGVVAARFTVQPAAGQRAFVLAAGALTPAAGRESFRLLVVDATSPTWTASAIHPH